MRTLHGSTLHTSTFILRRSKLVWLLVVTFQFMGKHLPKILNWAYYSNATRRRKKTLKIIGVSSLK